MQPWTVPALLLLAACGRGLTAYDVAADQAGGADEGDLTAISDADADTDVDADADADADTDADVEVAIDEVVPPYGVDAGGDNVEIFGGPFDPPVTVTFDGVEAQVLASEDDRISVLTPPGVEGPDPADVEVVTANGRGAAKDAFVYWADGTGLYGAWGTVEWNELLGDYWAPGSVSTGFAQVLFPVPSTLSWPELNYASAIDTCERDYAGASGTIYVYVPGVDPLTLTTGATTLDVSWDATYYAFTELSVPRAQIATGQAYDLPPLGTFGWVEDTVADFTGAVPTAMNVTSPNLDQASPPLVNRSFLLQWQGPYTGDYVLVFMQRQRWDGATFVPQENVTCWLADDGSFPIDGNSLFSQWNAANDYVLISVGRANEPSGTTLEHNRAASGVVGAYWVTGFLDAN